MAEKYFKFNAKETYPNFYENDETSSLSDISAETIPFRDEEEITLLSEVARPSTTSETRTKKHKLISEIDKIRIINAMENGEDYFHFGKLLGIARNSIKTIIYKYRKFGKLSQGKIGGSISKISEENGNKLLDFVEKNVYASLEEMKNFLITENLSVSTNTISRFLENHLITTKQIRPSVAERNSDRVLDLRMEYTTRYLEEAWMDSQLLYIDECGFNSNI